MRESIRRLRTLINHLGGDIEEKDIDLRDILHMMTDLIDEALPKEVEPD